jgi:hypothetical protein
MDQEQVKQAELQKEAEDRIAAFEFGMDLFWKDYGIEKSALADLAAIPEQQLTEVGIAVLEQAMAAQPQQ